MSSRINYGGGVIRGLEGRYDSISHLSKSAFCNARHKLHASKLLALPTYCKTSVNGYMDSGLVLRSKILALIDEAPEVESPPSPDLTKLVGELVEALEVTTMMLTYSRIQLDSCLGEVSGEPLEIEKSNQKLLTRAKEYLK